MMATDDHGMGIPVPDEHTQDYEFYALLRDAVDVIARRLAALATVPAPAPAIGPELRSWMDGIENAVNNLLQAEPVPAIGPELRSWMDGIENAVNTLATAEPAPAPLSPADRAAIDNIRQKQAGIDRALKLLEKEN